MSMEIDKNPIKISMSWSGGKDSAMALWYLMKEPRYDVVRLHTTFGEETRRVGMHGIAEELVEMQAKSIGLPLDKLYYPASGDNRAYEKAINQYLDQLESEGIRHIGYGDIYLEDLKKYREDKLSDRGFLGVFPLWKKDTLSLVQEFLAQEFSTKICAADADLIPEYFVGEDLSLDFIQSLKSEVDPCGEKGEFHTFCFEGPVFQKNIHVKKESVTSKTYNFKLSDGSDSEKRFWFAEIKKA